MDAIVPRAKAALGVLAVAILAGSAAAAAVVAPRLYQSDFATVADRVHALTVQVRARAYVADDSEGQVRVHDAISVASGVLVGQGVAIAEFDAVMLSTPDGPAPANEIEVLIDDVGAVPARLVAADENADVAVLQLPTAVRRLPGAVMADDAPAIGDAVLAIGIEGDSIKAAEVLLAGSENAGETDGRLRLDRNLPPPFRGGPLFDAQGRLVGVATRPTSAGADAVTTVSALRRLLQKAFAADGI